MTDTRPGGIRPWLLAAVAMLLLVILIVVIAQQQNSAVPPPGPALAPAMAAADPPGALMMAKSICEGQARIARKARTGSIAADEAHSGEKLYTETQAAVDELLAVLKSGMEPSAPADSQATIEARWTAAAGAMAAFMEWNARVELPRYFAADPLSEAFISVGPWLKHLKTSPGPLAEATGNILASARFADWATLGD